MAKLHLISILDMSGSMSHLTDDTIGGFNTLIADQGKDDVDVTLVLFNDKYQKVFEKVPVGEVPELTREVYRAMGMTALLDAIGKTVNEFETEKGEKVLLAITTDGQENASLEYNRKLIKKLLEEKQKENWEVLFIGANIDAISEADSLGIRPEMARQYVADKKGTEVLYKSMSKAVKAYACMDKLDESWAEDIDEDNKKRSR